MLKAFGFFEKRDSRDSRDNRDSKEIYYHSDDTLFRCRLFRLSRLCRLKKDLTKRETQFLVRRGQICSIAKEDPLGIVHIVQPEGSYFWDGTKMLPLITRNYQKLVFVSALFSTLSGRFGKKSNPVHSSIWSTDTV